MTCVTVILKALYPCIVMIGSSTQIGWDYIRSLKFEHTYVLLTAIFINRMGGGGNLS